MRIIEASNTRATNIQIQANWAIGGWKECVGRILATLNHGSSMRRLGLQKKTPTTATNIPAIAKSFVTHVELTAVGKVWAMAYWSDPFSCNRKCFIC